MFIPTTKEEIKNLGWDNLDIIIISGDTYIDSSYNGASLIGHLLMDKGYRVGIIAQPDINTDKDITRLGEPSLFWGITSGSVDSMVSNYTATKKRRNIDDLTPGNFNNKRPDRALIVYTNLIRRFFKNTVPIVLGGIEASLRRIAHYDYWSNKVRRSILFDAKADYLIYGMAEKSVIELADALKKNYDICNIKGLCYISKEKNNDYIDSPSFENAAGDKDQFIKMFDLFYENNDPFKNVGLQQRHGDRYLIHNPPSPLLSVKELDHVYTLPYERDVHPYYKKDGEVRALNTIKFSIVTHRGCYGECNFCSIALHQGRHVVSRSEESIIKEVVGITKHPDFKGIINDLGGPTANMYGITCSKMGTEVLCKDKRCLYPEICGNLKNSHKRQINLLKKINTIKGVKKIFVSSGLRYDMILADKDNGEEYLEDLLKNHVSGQLKLAPEHSEDEILKLMGKSGINLLNLFLKLFYKINNKLSKMQFLTYYFIAAHPGCTEKDMHNLKKYIKKELHINPEQVQVFTPTPSTYSTLMYYTGIDPVNNNKLFVERDPNKADKQKRIIIN